MATIAKRYFEGTDKHGNAATYGYEVAEEDGELVCLACGAEGCEYHPTDMGREGIWVAVRCKYCDLNTQCESGGLLDACYSFDNYRGECLLCGSSLKWSGETGKFHCADCGAECEIGKRLPRTGLMEACHNAGWLMYGEWEESSLSLDDGRIIEIAQSFEGAYFFSIGFPCGTDAARAAALANAELAKHGLPLIGVDAE